MLRGVYKLKIASKLISRNIKLFFRDKTSVFFSLLSVIILISLYLIFLSKVQYDGIQERVGDVAGIKFLINSWIMGGLVSIVSFTTTLSAFGTMINDREQENIYDFMVSPINNIHIVTGYVVSAGIIGLIMTVIATVFSQLFIYIDDGSLLDPASMLKVLSVLFISVLMATAINMFIGSLVKTMSAFTAVSTVIGTLIGFLTGVYVPIGSLPSTVKNIIMFFPPSHSGLVLKKIVMEKPLNDVFMNAPLDAINSYKVQYGVDFLIKNHNVTILESILYMIVITLVFFVLTLIVRRKMKIK